MLMLTGNIECAEIPEILMINQIVVRHKLPIARMDSLINYLSRQANEIAGALIQCGLLFHGFQVHNVGFESLKDLNVDPFAFKKAYAAYSSSLSRNQEPWINFVL